MNNKQLHRIPNDGVVGGVAAGMADYFGIDKALMRVIFVALFIFGHGFPMFLIYIILWVALPTGDKSVDGANAAPLFPASGAGTRNLDWLGYGLLMVGGLMLFDKMFYWIRFERYIPAMLFIGLGLFFIFKQSQKNGPNDTETYTAPGTAPAPEETNKTDESSITTTRTTIDSVPDLPSTESNPSVPDNDSEKTQPDSNNN